MASSSSIGRRYEAKSQLQNPRNLASAAHSDERLPRLRQLTAAGGRAQGHRFEGVRTPAQDTMRGGVQLRAIFAWTAGSCVPTGVEPIQGPLPHIARKVMVTPARYSRGSA